MAVVDNAVFPLLPSSDTLRRLRHLPSSIYNIDEKSILYKYVDAIVGDGGAGSVKKELLIARMNQRLDTTFFGDLDKVFGNLGGIARQASEKYSANPSSDLLTTAEWDEIRTKDSWYRARVKDFFAALQLGGTPDGLRKMVKAAIGVDCELYEMWRFQDHYAEIYGIEDVDALSNLITNPSFEYGTTGWSITTGGTSAGLATSTASGTFQDGTHSLRFTTGTTVTDPKITIQNLQVSPSKQYTISLYYYAPTLTNFPTGNFIIANKNAADGTISTLTSSNQTFLAASRDRISYTFSTPALTDHISFSFRLNGSITTPTDQFYIDSVMLSGGTLQAYFDGDTSGYRWTGIAGESGSVKASPIDALSRLKVPARNEIILYPHNLATTSLTVEEVEKVRELTKRVAPVDSVVTIASDRYAVNVPIAVTSVASDSTYFQVNSYVTANSDIQLLTEQEAPNPTHRWLESGVEVLAPNPAFMESQEYSQYYTYSTSDLSYIDSVTYSKESFGKEYPEDDYKIVEKKATEWTTWETFDLADADTPTNFPGGRNGQTPWHAPALNMNGSPYIFPYASQEDYIAQMKAIILSVGGVTRTYNDIINDPTLNPGSLAVVLGNTYWLRDSFGDLTDVQYKIPVASVENVLNSWQPDEAIANVAPVRSSTIMSGWFNRPV